MVAPNQATGSRPFLASPAARACSAAVGSLHGPVAHHHALCVPSEPKLPSEEALQIHSVVISTPPRLRRNQRLGPTPHGMIWATARIGDRKWGCISPGVMHQLRGGFGFCCGRCQDPAD